MYSKILYLSILATLFAGQIQAADAYALEPTINGGVSAGGLFASQAEEDFYHKRLAELLEPCINGGVSMDGRHASQDYPHLAMNKLASH